MNDYIVSFCVPVYENAEVAYQIASDLLKNPDQRFQVVMSDNQSKEDAVLSRLRGIKDSRLKLCTNQEGSTALLNWYNALENGDGRYLYLVMGRDKLRADGIPYLIEKLLWAGENGIALIKDREDDRGEFNRYDAYYYFLMQDHPTGVIFQKKQYKQILKRRSYFETFDTYPEIGIAGELIRCSKSALIDCHVFSQELYVDKRKTKSKMDLSGANDKFFFPKRRIKQMLDMNDLITADSKLTAKEREKLILSRCYLLFMQVSEQWKAWMGNEEDVLHYGLEKREVGIDEQERNIKEAENEICSWFRKQEWYGIVMRLKVKREAINAIKHIRKAEQDSV